jgi:hypothetical protein
MPSVFISYSHDSADPTHEDRVAGLVASLMEDGLEVFSDQNRNPTEDEYPWPIWMEGKLWKADYVLLVCTELYLKKIRREVAEDEGRGVLWEANLIYNRLYIAKLNTGKFVPILFSRSDEKFIPGPLQGASYRFVLDSKEGYWQLYAFLTGQHHRHFPKQGSTVLPIARKDVQRLFPAPRENLAGTPIPFAPAPENPLSRQSRSSCSSRIRPLVRGVTSEAWIGMTNAMPVISWDEAMMPKKSLECCLTIQSSDWSVQAALGSHPSSAQD